MIEKVRKVGRTGLVASAALVLLAVGQIVLGQQAGIDAALLAKANGGDAAAQVAVGEAYAAGSSVAQDLRLAAEWYRKAADKGDVAAQLHLAVLYRDGGKGFERDMAQAAEWYRRRRTRVMWVRRGRWGRSTRWDRELQQNYAEAYYWLDLAAAVKGPKQAQYAANRQMMGAHITADELAAVQEREAAWKAAHPR